MDFAASCAQGSSREIQWSWCWLKHGPCWGHLGEVELRCDFGALVILLALGPLVHKGVARPTPSVWVTRIGDSGPDGLFTCICCGIWVAGEPGDRKSLEQVMVKGAEEIGIYETHFVQDYCTSSDCLQPKACNYKLISNKKIFHPHSNLMRPQGEYH